LLALLGLLKKCKNLSKCFSIGATNPENSTQEYTLGTYGHYHKSGKISLGDNLIDNEASLKKTKSLKKKGFLGLLASLGLLGLLKSGHLKNNNISQKDPLQKVKSHVTSVQLVGSSNHETRQVADQIMKHVLFLPQALCLKAHVMFLPQISV